MKLFACILIVRCNHSVGRSLASVTCYDPAKDRWRRVAPLHQARQYPATIAHNGRLYVMGGWCRGDQDTVEVLIIPLFHTASAKLKLCSVWSGS